MGGTGARVGGAHICMSSLKWRETICSGDVGTKVAVSSSSSLYDSSAPPSASSCTPSCFAPPFSSYSCVSLNICPFLRSERSTSRSVGRAELTTR